MGESSIAVMMSPTLSPEAAPSGNTRVTRTPAVSGTPTFSASSLVRTCTVTGTHAFLASSPGSSRIGRPTSTTVSNRSLFRSNVMSALTGPFSAAVNRSIWAASARTSSTGFPSTATTTSSGRSDGFASSAGPPGLTPVTRTPPRSGRLSSFADHRVRSDPVIPRPENSCTWASTLSRSAGTTESVRSAPPGAPRRRQVFQPGDA